jgi:hypothetical protein
MTPPFRLSARCKHCGEEYGDHRSRLLTCPPHPFQGKRVSTFRPREYARIRMRPGPKPQGRRSIFAAALAATRNANRERRRSP